MKTESTLIEAQQICLEAAREVFNFLKIEFSSMEKRSIFSEEVALAIVPYNNGYEIKIHAFIDFNHCDNRMASGLPAFFSNIHIQPNNFFEDYIKEGKNARVEFSQFFKGVTGYKHTQVDVKTMIEFRTVTNLWVETIKNEITNAQRHSEET